MLQEEERGQLIAEDLQPTSGFMQGSGTHPREGNAGLHYQNLHVNTTSKVLWWKKTLVELVLDYFIGDDENLQCKQDDSSRLEFLLTPKKVNV